ncbi:hypothetical protein DEA98_22880 [Brucella pseudogrignonensis]|nr:hypothetical protein [Brucella pseudogrignonensis]
MVLILKRREWDEAVVIGVQGWQGSRADVFCANCRLKSANVGNSRFAGQAIRNSHAEEFPQPSMKHSIPLAEVLYRPK